MPLLRKGKCEIAQQEGKTGFVCFPKNEYLENPVEPLLLLNNFPSLSSLIEQFKIEDSIELKVWCDLEDSYSYKSLNSKVEKIGIYKAEDKVYYPAFLYDGKQKRFIPNYDENIDALNIARCFVRSSNGKKMFFYHKKSNSLNTTVYSELPILITRVLFLFLSIFLSLTLWLYIQINNNPVVTKTISVPISQDVNVPENVRVSFPIDTVELEIVGRKDTIDNIDASDIVVAVDYSGVGADTGVVNCPIIVSSAESNVYFRVQRQFPENEPVTIYPAS